ncbi:MAG: class I SAM-dependent methyltransferase [Sandaracinaceae bacterium]|nr:class I SAM-dependent methyltransferase [Sandaracinaceae bacterium]
MTAPRRITAGAGWWTDFFDEDFAALWLRDERSCETEARTTGLMRVLGLRPGDRVFDQCCGDGRVALPLVARGVHVEGVDGARGYITRARARTASLPTESSATARFESGDAFVYVPRAPCHAAINWYTSFGYVEDDTRNLAMLRAAYAALKPGGRFALDYPDVDRVRAHFRPRTVRARDTPDGSLMAVREATLDEARGMLVDRWTFSAPAGIRRVSTGETRLFSREELDALLRAAGFDIVRPVAPAEVGYPADAGRWILLAKRPERGGERA